MATWDENKRIENLAQHSFDFEGCEAIFDGPFVTWEDDREAYGEQRINAVGWLNGRLMHLTYTDEGKDIRVISLRKAEKHEIRRFAQGLSKNS